jgi:type I restriction enzyme M protein
MRKARILAVIGLDGNAFKPHTGTKTSVLILRKWEVTQPTTNELRQDYPIFFAVSKIPFKDNSGNYLYIEHSDGEYRSDLLDISEAFVQWGQDQFEKGDYHFDFLGD